MTDDIIEQAARVLSAHETFPGEPHPRDLHRYQARSLADAGLLARPLPGRDEVIDLLKWNFGPFLSRDPVNPDRFWGQSADAVLDLLRGQGR